VLGMGESPVYLAGAFLKADSGAVSWLPFAFRDDLALQSGRSVLLVPPVHQNVVGDPVPRRCESR